MSASSLVESAIAVKQIDNYWLNSSVTVNIAAQNITGQEAYSSMFRSAIPLMLALLLLSGPTLLPITAAKSNPNNLSPAAQSASKYKWSGNGAGNHQADLIARDSLPARQAMQYLRGQVETLRPLKLRQQVLDFLNNPAPTYQLKAVHETERRAVLAELRAQQLVPEATTIEGLYPSVNNAEMGAQSFLSAPGSYYSSATSSAGHHAYPGGLPIHTAFNLRAGLALMDSYRMQYQGSQRPYQVDRNQIVAGVVLHDIMKTLVFQWNADGTQFLEQRVADTGTHHVLGLAEQFARNFPAEIIIATAAAHNPPRPGDLRKKVINYLRAAAIIARVDPVQYGVLSKKGDEYDLTLPARSEHFIIHISDSDYFYSEYAAAAIVDRTRELCGSLLNWSKEDQQGARFNWLRNRLLAMNTGIGTYQMILQDEKALLPLIKAAAERENSKHKD